MKEKHTTVEIRCKNLVCEKQLESDIYYDGPDGPYCYNCILLHFELKKKNK